MTAVGAFFLFTTVSIPSVDANTAVTVRIAVHDANAKASAPSYVAMVPPYAPWSRPVAETLTEDGIAEFRVPPGPYQIVAGSDHRGVAIESVVVGGQRRNDFIVQLSAPRLVSGTVRDANGQPLRDAVIADVNAAIEPPLGRLSKLAAGVFVPAWTTTSDSAGNWSLAIPRDVSNPVVITAPGHAVSWSSPAAQKPVAVVLQRGGVVAVTVDRLDPAFVLTLSSDAVTSGVPALWQSQYWARGVDRNVVTWDSLAPGHYDIYAQQPERRTFSKAVKVGSVDVRAGERSDIRAVLPERRAVRDDAMVLFLAGVAADEVRALEAFARDGSGRPVRIRHSVEPSSGGTLLYLDDGGVQSPYFGVTADTLILAPAKPRGDSRDLTPQRAVVHQLAHAGFHVRSADPELALPEAGTAVFHECDGDATITLPAGVRADGTVTFPAPANCASFVVAFDPFGPLTFSKSLPPITPQWLGEFTLHASGSAGIRVVRDDDTPVPDADVRLFARTAASEDSLVPIATRTSRADGWTYFDGLPAARELSVVARTSEGDQSEMARFRVQPRGEATVERLLVPRPASLIVEPLLDTQFAAEFPGARIERIVLDPIRADAAGPVEQPLDGRERVEFSKLRPGQWRVTALIAAGGGMQPIDATEVELRSGESEHITPTLKPLMFRGRVTSRGRGIEGMVDIRGSRRSDIVPSVRTSPDGDFKVLLPRRDIYQVDVRTANPSRLVWIGEVPFVDPAKPIEIPFPDGEILVSVRAGKEPLEGVLVTARSQRDAVEGVQSLQTGKQTSERGEARLEGLLPGRWMISAATADAYAEKNVTITGETTQRIELDLASVPALTGTVRETFGAPVAGAEVECLLSDRGSLPRIIATTTSDDGRFSLTGVVSTHASLLCSVKSFAGVQGYRIVPGVAADLTLPAAVGELRVLSLPRLARLSSLWLVASDGRLINVSDFIHERGNDLALEIPALAPDRWALVRVASVTEWMTLTSGGASSLPALARVSLAPAERKIVDVSTGSR